MNRIAAGIGESLALRKIFPLIPWNKNHQKDQASALHLQEEEGEATEAQKGQKESTEGTEGPMG